LSNTTEAYYNNYTCVDREFQGNCILGPGFGFASDVSGLRSTSGKTCLFADEYWYQSGLSYLLIKRKNASCTWHPVPDEPPSATIFYRMTPSNVRCFVADMAGGEPILETCSLPSCTSLPYCDSMEEQRLGRPTLQQARDNFFKSSHASETDPSFNWVDDVNLPLPQKVQVSTPEMFYWALRQHSITEVEVTDSLRIERAHADGLPAFVRRPVRVFTSHPRMSIVVVGIFEDLSPWRSDHSRRMIIVDYGGVLVIEDLCTDGNMLAISSSWPQFSYLYTILDGGAVHFINSTIQVWCPEEATDALEFTMYMRRTYDAEHSVNAFDVMEEMGVDSDFVLTVPPKVPDTTRAIIPTADENTFFDDVSFQAGTLVRGLVRMQHTTLRCHRQGPVKCPDLDSAPPTSPTFTAAAAKGGSQRAEKQQSSGTSSGNSGISMIVWAVLAVVGLTLVTSSAYVFYRTAYAGGAVKESSDASHLESRRSLSAIFLCNDGPSSSSSPSFSSSQQFSTDNSGMVAMLSELSKVKEENQSLSSSVSDIAAQHLQKSVLKMRMAMVLKIQAETKRCLETYTRLLDNPHPVPNSCLAGPVPEFAASPPSLVPPEPGVETGAITETTRSKTSTVDCTVSSAATFFTSRTAQGMRVTGESSASLYSSVTEDTADAEDHVPAMLEPGQLVNGEASKYCVGRPIGIGQHSICYMVQDVHTRLEYCLKYPLRSTQKRWDEAAREAQLMSQAKHPHIVSMHESFVLNSRIVIVMELCELMDLQTLVQSAVTVQRRTLEEEFVMRIIMQLCMAVHYMHVEHNFVHRDIKLANVYINNRMDLKLGDLGGSKQLVGMTSTFSGTPMSMAPEVLTQQPYDLSSDIWSLGVLIYELCTLQPLFQASSVKSLVVRQLDSDKLATMREMGFSSVLIDFLSGMTEVDSSRRPTAAMLFENPILKNELAKAITEKRESLNKLNEFIELYNERELKKQARENVCSEEELWERVNAILE